MPEGSKWSVILTGKARKQFTLLPPDIAEAFRLLFAELRTEGPARVNWRNYGRIAAGKNEEYHHCHLNGGKPRYVAIWKVTDRKVRVMEIRYVGTHEKARYKRIR